ncbi:MAG: hypothetical protein WCT39_05220 [Candidatus Margulisiibacteriota bacterium]
MGYIYRTKGPGAVAKRIGFNSPSLDNFPSVKPDAILAPKCYLLEASLFACATKLIEITGLASENIPAPTPSIHLVDVTVEPGQGSFALHMRTMMVGRRKFLINLLFKARPDIIENMSEVEKWFPAAIAHELGHVIFPEYEFFKGQSIEVLMPQGHKIIFPAFPHWEEEDFGGLRELFATMTGLCLLTQNDGMNELKESYRSLTKAILRERLLPEQKSTTVQSHVKSALSIATGRYLHNGEDCAEAKHLLERDVESAINPIASRYLKFMREVRISP